MEVDIRVVNGIRHGNFSYGSIYGNVPSQAITTTNLNHLDSIGVQVDFGTKILEVFWWGGFNVLESKTRRDVIASKLAETISKNSNSICLLLPRNMKTRNANKHINTLLIELQKQAGFKFIKVYVMHNRNAIEDLESYTDIIPKEATIVPVIDEKLNNEVFKAVYMWGIKKKLPIIGFLGRDIGGNDTVNNNHRFIRGRKNDNVIRLVSDITKATANRLAKPLLFKWIGYDVFTFTTRRGSYRTPEPLRTFNGFNYVQLDEHRDIPCFINAENSLYNTAESFRPEGKETIPCSINNIMELNKQFKTLHDVMTEEELTKMLEPDIRVLSSPKS